MYRNDIYNPITKSYCNAKLEWETLAQVLALTVVLGVKSLVLLKQSYAVLNQDAEESSKPILNPTQKISFINFPIACK